MPLNESILHMLEDLLDNNMVDFTKKYNAHFKKKS